MSFLKIKISSKSLTWAKSCDKSNLTLDFTTQMRKKNTNQERKKYKPWNKEIQTLFLKIGPMLGLYLLQYMFFIVLKDTFSFKLSKKSSFLNVTSWRRGPWTFMKRGIEACMFLNHLFPEYYHGLAAHILRKNSTFFSRNTNS